MVMNWDRENTNSQNAGKRHTAVTVDHGISDLAKSEPTVSPASLDKATPFL
jgi:hypothetical protein